MVEYCLVNNIEDLLSILKLSRQNLKSTVPVNSHITEGFVTLNYTLDELKSMSRLHNQVVAKETETNKLVAYALVLHPKMSFEMTFLVSLVDQVNELTYEGVLLRQSKYIIMGQICVHKDYRGKGLFKMIYKSFIEATKDSYDYIITEINSSNIRSLKAHFRIGFQKLHEFKMADGESWVIVILTMIKR